MKKHKIENLELWKKFQKEKNEEKKAEIKKQLVEIYYPLVQKISYKAASNLEWNVAAEELASYGVDGLYSAIDRFSLDRGVNFPTYANLRISGSMIDAIRKIDFVPRSVRTNQSLIDKTRQQLEKEEGRKITDYEIVEKLGINQHDYLKNIKKYSPLNFISIEGSDISNTDTQSEFKQDSLMDLSDKKSVPPDSNLLRKEFLNKLISKNFSPLEQKIIYYYYYENLTMGEIGERIGSSESRISQIHVEILERLKDKIERNPEFFGNNIENLIKNCNNVDPLF